MKIFTILAIFWISQHGNIQLSVYRLDKIKSEIKDNYYKAETDTYIILLGELDSLKSANSKNWRINYYAGFISLQLGKIWREKNTSRAVICLEESIRDLKKAHQLYPHSELLLLLSSACGKLASVSFFKAMQYGSDADEYLQQAKEIAEPDMLARLNLVEATHLMFTPEMFGGDKKQAEELLIKVLEFETQQQNSLINWAGDAEIYAYLAQLELEKENYDQAVLYCRQALRKQPGYRFVLNDLQKEIEKNKGE